MFVEIPNHFYPNMPNHCNHTVDSCRCLMQPKDVHATISKALKPNRTTNHRRKYDVTRKIMKKLWLRMNYPAWLQTYENKFTKCAHPSPVAPSSRRSATPHHHNQKLSDSCGGWKQKFCDQTKKQKASNTRISYKHTRTHMYTCITITTSTYQMHNKHAASYGSLLILMILLLYSM